MGPEEWCASLQMASSTAGRAVRAMGVKCLVESVRGDRQSVTRAAVKALARREGSATHHRHQPSDTVNGQAWEHQVVLTTSMALLSPHLQSRLRNKSHVKDETSGDRYAAGT